MITKQEFYKFITNFQAFDAAVVRIERAISGGYAINLYESDWFEAVGMMLDAFLDSHFTEDGCDLIFWWLFEDVDKIIYEKVDPDLFNGETKVEYDVNTFDNLWNYMIKHEKDYIKNV